MLISINKVYTGTDDAEFNMRHDWNSLLATEEDTASDPSLLFKHYTEALFPHREYLVKYLRNFAEKTKIKIQYNTTVEKISRDSNKLFVLKDSQGNILTCKYLWVATGAVEQHIPMIPGIEKALTYSNYPREKEYWINKRVLILGKGNSAFELADELTPWCSTIHCCSPHPVTLAWDTHYVGNLRAVNNNFLDLYQLKSQHGMISGLVKQLTWRDEKEVTKEKRRVAALYDFTVSPDDPVVNFQYDEVIVCTGWNYVDKKLWCPETCRLNTTVHGRYPCVSPIWESSSQPNLFIAGTAMGGRGHKQNTSGFIHGFRYCIRSQVSAFLNREYGQPLPSQKVKFDAEALTNHIVERVNRCSAPYQMFSVLVDALVLPKVGEPAPEQLEYIEELPTDYLKDLPVLKDTPYIEVMLQYGDRNHLPAFEFEQQSVPGRADLSWALHPCLRLYYNGKVVARHHMLETAELNWDIPVYHQKPLKMWLESIFDTIKSPELGKMPDLPPEMPLVKWAKEYRKSEFQEMRYM